MFKSTSLAIALSLAALAAPAHAVVINGDFEDVSASTPGRGLANGAFLSNLASGPGASWDVFTSIPGWTTTAGAGIEVQTNRTIGSINARSGLHYIELDSHPKPNSNSTMAQTLNLASGVYQLDFYYSPRTGDVGSNGIEYSVFNAASASLLAGSVTGPNATAGTAVGLWTLVSTLFTVGGGDSPVTLSFAATGKADTLGGFLDDIKVTRVAAVPLPAAAPLLVAGLGALVFVARRRRKAA